MGRVPFAGTAMDRPPTEPATILVTPKTLTRARRRPGTRRVPETEAGQDQGVSTYATTGRWSLPVRGRARVSVTVAPRARTWSICATGNTVG